MKLTTPYTEGKKTSFWRTGVRCVQLGEERFHRLHSIEINKEKTKISSAGSCFAQHVGKWLLDRGYSFCQSSLYDDQIASFAFGNIYTPRSLIQWIEMNNSINQNKLEHSIYFDGHKYFDLLRPSFNPLGFNSAKKLEVARIVAVTEMISILKKTDLFIFTLGLTEAWKNKNGLIYPSCPGVVSGVFDEKLHSFHNFTHSEIMSDMEEMLTAIRQIKSNIKFVLTVSPVPLTATATENHILVANSYSKSVLRSVAGELSEKLIDVEYFPSFEIITVPSDDFRFKDNLRSVSSRGVAYVMSHFSSAGENISVDDNLDNIKPIRQEKGEINPVNADEICEDSLLDLEKKTEQELFSHFNLSLIGDSQMGLLSSAMKERGIQHCGGGIMNGSAFTDGNFAICNEEYFVPLENSESRKRWELVFNNLRRHEENNTVKSSIVMTNIGVQAHKNAGIFSNWFVKQPKNESLSMTDKIINFINNERINNFKILSKLHDAGHNVIVVSDPPFSQYYEYSKLTYPIINSYNIALEVVCNQIGITFFNVASLFNNEVSDPLNYVSDITFADGTPDWFHGNNKYYNWLSSKIELLIENRNLSIKLISTASAFRAGCQNMGHTRLTELLELIDSDSAKLSEETLLTLKPLLNETLIHLNNKDYLELANILEMKINPLLISQNGINSE
jgi:hypothetical protein